MNKIEFINNKINIISEDIEINLKEKKDIFDILRIHIKVNTKTKLEIISNNYKDLKIDIVMDIEEDLDLLELNSLKDTKIRYIYNVKENKKLNILKFYNGFNIREQDVINLDKKANVNFNLKTIAQANQKIEVITNHNGINSISNISNKGVSIDKGLINFNVTSVVERGITGCNADQYSRIISLNESKNIISPILLIDEYDVQAEHSAYMGGFNKNELFYIQSRGISYNKALYLLIKGFLKEEDERIIKIIDKYWR